MTIRFNYFGAKARSRRQFKRGVKRIKKSYKANPVLFPRDELVRLDKAIQGRSRLVFLKDLDNVRQPVMVEVPAHLRKWKHSRRDKESCYLPRIRYNSIESLTIHDPTKMYGNPTNTSLSIFHGRCTPRHPYRLRRAKELYDMHKKEWYKTGAFRCLIDLLSAATFKTPIDKIVCFGLGTTKSYRSCLQHNAAQTISTALKILQEKPVPMYSQDPAYNDLDKELLEEEGFVIVDDPKGLLEITATTLIFSMNPGFPLKQIVCDGQWPAAMLWNWVPPENSKGKIAAELPKKMRTESNASSRDGKWIPPYSPDPYTSRVRKMHEHYDAQPYVWRDSSFFDEGPWYDRDHTHERLSLYIKKPNPEQRNLETESVHPQPVSDWIGDLPNPGQRNLETESVHPQPVSDWIGDLPKGSSGSNVTI